ncbi:transposase [Jiella sonneratiae]|uniref:Transposase n=1 Tax=Jiella sonneratiae TaxID=2816856 RepID=A0ABS3JA18_9HYPH|nr:transposase [Jiella sonneratiae]MBO0906512.1 transposase [Jiella sonneratiae]
MRRTNHTDAEILSLLHEAEAGVPISDICASAYVSQRTFYRWRKRFGGLKPEALKRLRTLELENQHLRILVGRLRERNPDGVWSGWSAEEAASARSGLAEDRWADGVKARPAPRAGRHCGSGHAAGRFASLRAGRC